jgi:uncharacterized membrane protein YbhN (UPF0104 family)
MYMSERWKAWVWTGAKVILTLAILFFVGRQFYRDLTHPDIERLPWRPGWMLFSAALYLLFLGILTGYWYHLLRIFGEGPSPVAALRAYYIGLLGKYVPGKAWALLLRGTLVRGPGVRLGVAIVTGFYEVLTTMSAGALVAGVGLLVFPIEMEDWDWHPLWVALALLVLCIVPILPGVANFVARRMAARFQEIEAYRLPPVRGRTLLVGLLLTSLGWGILGISVWMIFQAVMPVPPALSWTVWGRLTTAMALAYVAGFLVLVVPGGIGVREFFLLHLLADLGTAQEVAAAVLLLRLVWTAAEAVAAGAVFFWRPRAAS